MYRFIALSIAIVLLSTSVAHAIVRITEINWMGNAESQFAEWFELYNDSTDSVDLSGWGLYEDGGGQLIFSLTKSIPAQGYLLVERTTTTSPDPVPGINDESGSFGGSGFSNIGESLVLKDLQGTAIQTLDFSSGWPAGDAATKQTMQWDGTKWVTANATPKAPFQGVALSSPEAPSSGTAWSAPKIVPHIEITLPKTVYATVASEYSQKTFLDYGEVYNGVFLWNMGDGTLYRNNTPTQVAHTYKYPGTYTLTFAYYRTPYDTKPLLFQSQEQVVISPTITLNTIPDKGFEFVNTGTTSIDLSNWVLVLPNNIIELPAFTIIAPKKKVLMPFSAFGIEGSYSQATLQTPQRVVVGKDKTRASLVSNPEKVSSTKDQEVPSEVFYKSSNLEASSINALPSTPEDSKTKTKTGTKSIIFAVVLVIVISLFVILERFIRLRQEE